MDLSQVAALKVLGFENNSLSSSNIQCCHGWNQIYNVVAVGFNHKSKYHEMLVQVGSQRFTYYSRFGLIVCLYSSVISETS